MELSKAKINFTFWIIARTIYTNNFDTLLIYDSCLYSCGALLYNFHNVRLKLWMNTHVIKTTFSSIYANATLILFSAFHTNLVKVATIILIDDSIPHYMATTNSTGT